MKKVVIWSIVFNQTEFYVPYIVHLNVDSMWNVFFRLIFSSFKILNYFSNPAKSSKLSKLMCSANNGSRTGTLKRGKGKCMRSLNSSVMFRIF